MRSLATGLESYYIDQKAYPPGAPMAAYARTIRVEVPAGGRILSIPDRLTTPVAYLLDAFPDSLARGKSEGIPFAYYSDGGGWILFSVGPDGDYDITNPAAVYDSSIVQPSVELITGGWTYDPTNGLESSGDVWRTKQ